MEQQYRALLIIKYVNCQLLIKKYQKSNLKPNFFFEEWLKMAFFGPLWVIFGI